MTLSRFGTLFLSTLSLRRATMAFCMDCQKSTYFYPRSPCGERLGLPVAGRIAHRISIHALLAESDLTNAHNSPNNQISIHALLAESDLCAFVSLFGVFLFLSTLSLRRATLYSSSSSTPAVHFYPRSPCGERPDDLGDRLGNYCISIHALLAESDRN